MWLWNRRLPTTEQEIIFGVPISENSNVGQQNKAALKISK